MLKYYKSFCGRRWKDYKLDTVRDRVMTRPECYPPVWYSELADLADGNGLGRVFAEGDENAFCDLTAAAAKLYGSLMGLTADEV